MIHPNDKPYVLGDDPGIFVFGSNLAGVHGAGAALYARKELGAIWGQAEGHMGESYAIPTKDEKLNTLPLERIHFFIGKFIVYAICHPELRFFVTRIGCGLAGYTDKDIAPLFVEAATLPNCELPKGWDKPETL